MFRKWMSCFLIVVMVALLAFPALAAVATPANTGSWGNVASASDAHSVLDDYVSVSASDLDMGANFADAVYFSLASPDSSRALDFENTVDYTSCVLTVFYYDMSNTLHHRSTTFDSSGMALLSRPDDFARPYSIAVYLNSGALPPSGKYSARVHFGSHTGGFTYKDPYVHLYNHIKNANTQVKSYVPSFSQSSGSFTSSFTFDGSTCNQVRVSFGVSSNFGFPYGGKLTFSLTRLSSSADVDVSVGDPPSTEEILQNNAANTNQIANNTSEMAETLKEIVQTISNQLAALWDQMFNLIHLPEMLNWDQNTQKIIDALQGELNIQIDNDNEIAIDIMDNDDKNTDAIIKNDDKNTDQITNGYDNSKFKDQNNKLDSAISEYDQAEDAVLSSVSGYLEGFQMPSYSSVPSGVLTACIYYGNYLQRLFEAIGFFNFPITLSLTMVFVLMLVGYHRFRAG